MSSVTGEDPGSSHIRRITSGLRPRPILSCLRCRSRKIKCNRLLPCRQCTLTGNSEQCSYNARTESGKVDGPQTLNGSISRQALTDLSLENIGDSSYQAPFAACTESEGSAKAETIISLQQRLQKLERLYTTHYCAPMMTAGHENDGRETDGSLSKADAALSIKISGPRYHSQSYKKSLLHHVSLTCTYDLKMCS